MEFTKAHGTGNDFVVIADPDDRLDLTPGLVRALCDRRFGIGADGVLRIAPSDAGDVFMDYRNADGSIVEMCGNGVRVVAKWVLDRRGVAAGDELEVDTRAGVRAVEARRGGDGLVVEVTVDMGMPTIGEPTSVKVDGQAFDYVPVDVGNPHAILRVAGVGSAPVETVGPGIERHRDFPNGVNVEFAHVLGEREVDLRVWERGVGETMACGTGACATQVALHRLGLVGDDVTIHLPGGDLRVRWHDGADGIEMTGAAVEVAAGTIDAGWLAAAKGPLAAVAGGVS